MIYLPEDHQLIASDLVYYRVHPWLMEGRSQQWLEQLDLVRGRYKDVVQVFNGHGEDSTLQGLDEQMDYITLFRSLVDQHRQDGVVSVDRKAEIRKAMLDRYPSYPLDFLIEMNVEAIAKELAG